VLGLVAPVVEELVGCLVSTEAVGFAFLCAVVVGVTGTGGRVSVRGLLGAGGPPDGSGSTAGGAA